MNSAIAAKNISKSFGSTNALKNVSLQVEQGKVLGLLGPNGAGKTTLVRILTTLLPPDKGSATVNGFDVQKQADEVRRTIGLAGQYAAVDENLTGYENLEMVGRLYQMPKSEARTRAWEVLERMDIKDAANRPVKTYSGGMRRRLDLGASFIFKPKILFLDEPTTGLDPRTRIDLWQTIRELLEGGATVLLTTQYLEEADELADSIVVIDRGKLIAQGTSDQLKSRLGSEVLEIQVASNLEFEKTQKIIADLKIARRSPELTPKQRLISFPVKNGTDDLLTATRALDNSSITITHISLDGPSLDDVFLSLTGSKTKVSDDA